MIITNIKDYYEIHESLQVLNEGSVWNWIRNKSRRIMGMWDSKLDNLIAPPIVDTAINSKSGNFDPKVIDVKGIADTNNSIADVFAKLEKMLPRGKYIKTGLSYLKEYSEKADAEFASNVAKDVMDKDSQDGTQGSISKNAGEALTIRAKEYSEAFKKKNQHLTKMIEQEIKDFMVKANEKKDPNLPKIVSMRYNNAKAVLLLLEYEIKKKRWNLEDLGDLTDQMATTYKTAVTKGKELAANIGNKRAEIRDESKSKFAKVVTKKYPIGTKVSMKAKAGGEIDAEVVDFDDDKDMVKMKVVGSNRKPVDISYEEFLKWVIPEGTRAGL